MCLNTIEKVSIKLILSPPWNLPVLRKNVNTWIAGVPVKIQTLDLLEKHLGHCQIAGMEIILIETFWEKDIKLNLNKTFNTIKHTSLFEPTARGRFFVEWRLESTQDLLKLRSKLEFKKWLRTLPGC